MLVENGLLRLPSHWHHAGHLRGAGHHRSHLLLGRHSLLNDGKREFLLLEISKMSIATHSGELFTPTLSTLLEYFA